MTWEVSEDDTNLSDTDWEVIVREPSTFGSPNADPVTVRYLSTTFDGDNATIDEVRTMRPLRFVVAATNDGLNQPVSIDVLDLRPLAVFATDSPANSAFIRNGNRFATRKFPPTTTHWKPGRIDSIDIDPGFATFFEVLGSGQNQTVTPALNTRSRLRAFRIWEDGTDSSGVVPVSSDLWSRGRSGSLAEILFGLNTPYEWQPKLGAEYVFDVWYQYRAIPHPNRDGRGYTQFAVGSDSLYRDLRGLAVNISGRGSRVKGLSSHLRIFHTPAVNVPVQRRRMLQLKIVGVGDLTPGHLDASVPLDSLRWSRLPAETAQYHVPHYLGVKPHPRIMVPDPNPNRGKHTVGIIAALNEEIPQIRVVRVSNSRNIPALSYHPQTDEYGDSLQLEIENRFDGLNSDRRSTREIVSMPMLDAKGVWDQSQASVWKNYTWPKPAGVDPRFRYPDLPPDTIEVRVVPEVLWFSAGVTGFKITKEPIPADPDKDEPEVPGEVQVFGRLQNNDPRYDHTLIEPFPRQFSGFTLLESPTQLAQGQSASFAVGVDITAAQFDADTPTFGLTYSWDSINEEDVNHSASISFVGDLRERLFRFNLRRVRRLMDSNGGESVVITGTLRNASRDLVSSITGPDDVVYDPGFEDADEEGFEPFLPGLESIAVSFELPVSTADLQRGTRIVSASFQGVRKSAVVVAPVQFVYDLVPQITLSISSPLYLEDTNLLQADLTITNDTAEEIPAETVLESEPQIRADQRPPIPANGSITLPITWTPRNSELATQVFHLQLLAITDGRGSDVTDFSLDLN